MATETGEKKPWYCVRCDDMLIMTKREWQLHEKWHSDIKRTNMKVRFK